MPLIVILSDIFGQSQALKALAQAFKQPYLILDPYQGRHLTFTDESNAYSFFTQHVGIEGYFKHAKYQLEQISEPFELVGFSVGACIAWRLAALDTPYWKKHLQQVFCFYGSQIRNFKELQPQVPTELIFPLREVSFSVEALIETLKRNHRGERLKIKQVDELHGFMNALSDNFNATAYQRELKKLTRR